jgi:MATE family multidrug resistance protein
MVNRWHRQPDADNPSHSGLLRPSGGLTDMRATLALSYPLIFTNLAQALIPATNVVLLGWAGPKSLAAGALGVNLYNAFMVFGTGLISAVAPMMAQSVGRRTGSLREIRRSVRQALWAAMLILMPIWGLLWHTDHILVFFGQDASLSREAASMVRPMMFGLLPLFVYQILRSFVTVLDRPGWSFAVGAIAVCLNAIINYALILGHFGFSPLGLFGAGIGSTIANCVLGVGLAIVVVSHRRFRRFHLFGHLWRPDRQRLVHIFRLGLPIAGTQVMETTFFNVAVLLVGLLGQAQLAAHAVAIQVCSVCIQVPNALGQAATIRVARAHGRGDLAAIGRAGWAAFAITIACMTCVGVLMLAAPHWLAGLFMTEGGAHEQVVNLAASFLVIAALFQIADGTQIVGAGMLRGLQDATVPMVISAISYWGVGIGTAWYFAFHLGWEGEGVWIGLAVGLSTAAVVLMARWALRIRLKLI